MAQKVKGKRTPRKPRVWRMWAVIAPWGVRAVGVTRQEAECLVFNDDDKVRRVRVEVVS